jgi:hypothetical protein
VKPDAQLNGGDLSDSTRKAFFRTFPGLMKLAGIKCARRAAQFPMTRDHLYLEKKND